ncbi:MAG TPA: ribonuclease M5 [Clostridiaceae bacterium]|nr:ribonuclease M5 [Clostridiaceae bacterium]HBX48045.1 ribonuclease M5 [Clostridiaceae bacterium]HCL51342.1 ribonuclease M5 [Clostridiaceae bacterium]
MIKEVIVVEGKDDVAAVKGAVDAEVISTSGFGITKETMEKIKSAAKRCGIIVFTDPDSAGEAIRRIIQKNVPDCKHAFIPKELALKDGDIGIENASSESIKEALSKVKTEVSYGRKEFTYMDLFKNKLADCSDASLNRNIAGRKLGIGYTNAKQFLNRLNRYGITRDEFNEAVKSIQRS